MPGGHQHGLGEEAGVPACSPGASTGDGEEEAGARRQWGAPFAEDTKEASSATCVSCANVGPRCPHSRSLPRTESHSGHTQASVLSVTAPFPGPVPPGSILLKTSGRFPRGMEWKLQAGTSFLCWKDTAKSFRVPSERAPWQSLAETAYPGNERTTCESGADPGRGTRSILSGCRRT